MSSPTTPQCHQQHQLAAAPSGDHHHHHNPHSVAAASSSSVEKSHSQPLQLSSAYTMGHQQAVTLATFVNTHDHDNFCDVTVTEDDDQPPQATRRENDPKTSSSHSASGSRKALPPSGSTTLSTSTPLSTSTRGHQQQQLRLNSNSVTSANHNRSTHSNETSVFTRSASMLLLDHITCSTDGKPLGAESSPYSALSPGYKTPKQFLQHTPPEKSRTEGIKEINVLKKKHEEHLMTLAPIVTDILVGAIMDQNSPEGAFGSNSKNNNNSNGGSSEPRLPGAVASSDDDNCYTVRDDDGEEEERPIPPSALESQPVYRQYETPGINSKRTLFLYIQYLLVESWASTASFVASLILIDRFLAKMCGTLSTRVNATVEADRHRKTLLASSLTSDDDDEHQEMDTKKKSPPPFRLTFLNAFKLFVAASRIATKVVEMRVCDNRAFAKAARITTNSVSLIEARFLNDMDFEVCVLKSDWDTYAKKILAHI